MGLDDVVSTESAIVATATAAVFSPRTRETLRRGAVFGVAGLLKAGDVVAGAARGVARGVRGQERVTTPAGGGDGATSDAAAPATASTRRGGTRAGTRSARGGASTRGGTTS